MWSCKSYGERVRGHLKYVCSRISKNVFNDNADSQIPDQYEKNDGDSDSSSNLFTVICINVKSSAPIQITVSIENVDLTMEIDTGSAVSLISDNVYKDNFKYLNIQVKFLK